MLVCEVINLDLYRASILCQYDARSFMTADLLSLPGFDSQCYHSSWIIFSKK